jgi:phosphoribosylformimino-5-aminoimidazole carboxamide ribotide isomerase
VVRLYRGSLEEATVYSEDPVGTARRWAAAGALRLHVVDLDGAACGHPVHLGVIADLVRSVSVPVQAGGGLRCEEHVAAVLEAGARWAILGSGAVRDPHFVARCLARWPGRIMVSLDLRSGRVAADAWRSTVAADGPALARAWGEQGLADLIVTDTERDGTLSGVDPGIWEPFLDGPWRLWAAGGVAGEEDLRRLRPLEQRGLAGVIVGRAVYTGRVRPGVWPSRAAPSWPHPGRLAGTGEVSLSRRGTGPARSDPGEE